MSVPPRVRELALFTLLDGPRLSAVVLASGAKVESVEEDVLVTVPLAKFVIFALLDGPEETMLLPSGAPDERGVTTGAPGERGVVTGGGGGCAVSLVTVGGGIFLTTSGEVFDFSFATTGGGLGLAGIGLFLILFGEITAGEDCVVCDCVTV